MTSTLKWFSRPADEPIKSQAAIVDAIGDADDDLQDYSVMPAHVQEFLDLKTASGF